MSALHAGTDGEDKKEFSLSMVSDAEAVQLLMSTAPAVPDLNGFSLGTENNSSSDLNKNKDKTKPSEATGDTDTSMIEVDTTQFGDFQFHPFDTPLDNRLHDDPTTDLFGPTSPLPRAPTPPSPSRAEVVFVGNNTTAAASAANTTATESVTKQQAQPPHPLLPPPPPACNPTRKGSRASHDARTTRPRRLSFDGATSEDGSMDSNNGNHAANSLLDEPVSDEFGLVLNGSVDSIDLGGNGNGPRPAALNKGDRPGEAAPPWSELKTKAGKERKRLPLACIACRRKKIRCSGEKPACKHCLRSRIPCVYKVTARKAAPRTDYMAMLDKRLKRMEERIIKIAPKSEQETPASSSVTRAVVKPAIPGSTTAAGSTASGAGNAKSSRKRVADDAFGPELDHWARANPRNRVGDEAGPHNILLQQESEENKLLHEGAEALPCRELQEHLAEVFFENIYGQAYHLLHKPSYMRKLKAGKLPPVLILSVCAVSARFSSHPSLGHGPNFLRGEEWAAPARDIVTRRYEWPNITILTCFLLLGLHEFGTCHGGRSWALGGQAIRMAFALQLHKDLEHEPTPFNSGAPLSFIDREIRRRTMWACFLMDRFNSSGTDRPMFIKEETIKIQLPIKEKYFQLDMRGPTENLEGHPVTPPAGAHPGGEDDGHLTDATDNMGVAAYMIRAIAVWGRVINYLNQGGKEADPHPMWSPDSEYTKLAKQASDMLAQLPSALTFTPENLHLHDTEGMANQFVFLHIAIQQTILFMNRFAISSSPNSNVTTLKDVPKAFVTKAGAKAFAAANRISELLKEAESYLICAPFVGYCAFLSSTVHIFGIFSGNPAMEATSKRNLATNVKFLSKMKRYWGMFHFMAENLREQYRTCADAARKGTPASENPASSSPIFQYGDWFDRYPHGVSNTDFVDPVAYNKKKEKGDDAVLEQKPQLHTVEEFIVNGTGQNTTVQAIANSAATAAAAAGTSGPNGTGSRRDSIAGNRPTGTVGRRKSVARKAGSVSSRGTEPLRPDLGPENAQHQQQHPAVHTLQQRRTFPGSLAGQAGGVAGFSGLTLPHSQGAETSFHAAPISPLTPATMGPFSHHQQSLYSSDLLAMSLSQQSHGLLPELDRQLVFGAYGNNFDHAMNNQASLDDLVWESHGHGRGNANTNANPNRTNSQAAAAASTTADSAIATAADAMQAFASGLESSSAWFMPFNMEPPEITQDIGGVGGIDQFSGLFGGGSSMISQNGANMGGLHHAT